MVAAVMPARAPASPAQQPPATRANILIVDDLAEKHLVMTSVLEVLGQNIVSARSGREALRLILQMEFAVILLDVNMPDIDGLETAGLIRQYKKTAQTPILFITSYVDDEQVAKGYALGAVDYIASPVVPEILRSKVKVFVDLHRMNQELQLQAAVREELARAETRRVAAEQAIRRADYLAHASQRLGLSLNFDATMMALVDIAVPALGPVGLVVLRTSTHELEIRKVKIGASDFPSRSSGYAPVTLTPAARALLESTLLSGKGESFASLPLWEGMQPDLINAGLNIDAAPERLAICPLVAGERALGAFLLLGNEASLQSADLALLSEIGGRAAIAMENARLFGLVQEADRRKNEFLAMLAHELRNPLAPIRNAVRIISGVPQVDPTVGWARDIIGRQVDHMSRMVDDLLDVSRIVRGKVAVQREALLLSTLFERSIETSKPFMEARQQQFEVSLPEHDVMLHADLVRLSQVLSNLLNNASKFTPTGGHISLAASFADGSLRITVSDNGQGIAAEFLPHIFGLFIQGDQALDRSQGGLGIGLTLVKHLLELHDGRVEARSEGKDKGTQISVTLPAEAAATGAAPRPEPRASSRTVATQRARKVMVVDDLPASADTLKVLLEMDGCEVRVANDGVTALSAAQGFLPDVVILDIGLPGMDGFEVARRLRHRPEFTQTVLVALTGYGEAESRLRSRQAGFDHHIVKPADIDSLLEIVNQNARPAAER
jgi:signal transduction histidine kinase/DNA-binding response OmpR family regulator